MTSEAVWYLAIGGKQVGPVSARDVETNVKNGIVDGATLAFGPGVSEWTPLRRIPAFSALFGAVTSTGSSSSGPRRAHEIDYEIRGNDMQFVEVELDPGECAIAEAGALMYMTQGIGMETVFGDGNRTQMSFLDKLVGAGKRLITGESLFITVYENRAQAKERVAFAAPYPGKILPMDLAELGGELICQKDSFLCAARGVQIGVAFTKKIGVGLFGGEGFILQRLTGDGLCFVHAGGCVHALELQAGEKLRVDTGCIVAMQKSVEYDIQFVGGLKTALFGGEGIFFATLTGPGRIWLQSLPLSRLADRIYAAAPQTGAWRKEEGSVLDRAFGLGNLIDGRE